MKEGSYIWEKHTLVTAQMRRMVLWAWTDTLWPLHGKVETQTKTFEKAQELDVCEKHAGVIHSQHLWKGRMKKHFLSNVASIERKSQRCHSPGAHTSCLTPFSSCMKCLPSPRTCLKTKSFFWGLVIKWPFQYCLQSRMSWGPPSLFPQQLDGFFFYVWLKLSSCSAKFVLYLARVRLSSLKCLRHL